MHEVLLIDNNTKYYLTERLEIMLATFSTYAWVMGAIAIVAYIAIRVISSKMMVWDKAETQEDANDFRRAIFSYKPIWFAYAAWFILGFATLFLINKDGSLSYLPVIWVIVLQFWSMRTPRAYRSVFSKVLCGMLPFTLAFYCVTYPSGNPLVFASLLVWLLSSMATQVFTLRAISMSDFFSQMDNAYAFDNSDDLEGNVFGIAGNGLEDSDLDADNVSVGIKGEIKTASILNKLADENPDLYVFHSVAWLSNATYDIDHVLCYKGSIIFLDSKFWGKGVHEIGTDGGVYKDDERRDLDIHLPAALEEYVDAASNAGFEPDNADVWVVVHGHNDNHVTIGPSNTDGKNMSLIAGRDLEDEVENWMSVVDSDNDSGMDSRLISLFHDHLK